MITVKPEVEIRSAQVCEFPARRKNHKAIDKYLLLGQTC